MRIKDLHHLGKICQASSQAINFVNHYNINQLGLDVDHQLFKAWSLHVPA